MADLEATPRYGERGRQLLAAVGLSEDEERAYVLVIGAGALTAAGVAERLELPVRRAHAALSALESQGLVSRSLARPPEYMAAPPDVAVPALVLRRQEELQQVRLVAIGLAEQARRAAARAGSGPELLELVSGSEAIKRRFAQLQHAAEREVCMLDRPPYLTGNPPGNPSEVPALARGVCFRAIYDPEALGWPGQPAELRAWMAAGEQARVFPGVPTKMMVVDARTALIPLEAHQPGHEVLLVRAPAVVDSLQMFFEVLWAQATPLTAPPEPAGSQRPDRTGQQEDIAELVSLLAAGLKDETIARQLGISPRTLDRRMKSFMHSLAAQTRFQAGWQAACRFGLTASAAPPPAPQPRPPARQWPGW